jgi:hypothetical protein
MFINVHKPFSLKQYLNVDADYWIYSKSVEERGK